MTAPDSPIVVVDLFTSTEDMSSGFEAHGALEVIGAADAEIGEFPCSDRGTQCNTTHRNNSGIDPKHLNLADAVPWHVRDDPRIGKHEVNRLSVCVRRASGSSEPVLRTIFPTMPATGLYVRRQTLPFPRFRERPSLSLPSKEFPLYTLTVVNR